MAEIPWFTDILKEGGTLQFGETKDGQDADCNRDNAIAEVNALPLSQLAKCKIGDTAQDTFFWSYNTKGKPALNHAKPTLGGLSYTQWKFGSNDWPETSAISLTSKVTSAAGAFGQDGPNGNMRGQNHFHYIGTPGQYRACYPHGSNCSLEIDEDSDPNDDNNYTTKRQILLLLATGINIEQQCSGANYNAEEKLMFCSLLKYWKLNIVDRIKNGTTTTNPLVGGIHIAQAIFSIYKSSYPENQDIQQNGAVLNTISISGNPNSGFLRAIIKEARLKRLDKGLGGFPQGHGLHPAGPVNTLRTLVDMEMPEVGGSMEGAVEALGGANVIALQTAPHQNVHQHLKITPKGKWGPREYSPNFDITSGEWSELGNFDDANNRLYLTMPNMAMQKMQSRGVGAAAQIIQAENRATTLPGFMKAFTAKDTLTAAEAQALRSTHPNLDAEMSRYWGTRNMQNKKGLTDTVGTGISGAMQRAASTIRRKPNMTVHDRGHHKMMAEKAEQRDKGWTEHGQWTAFQDDVQKLDQEILKNLLLDQTLGQHMRPDQKERAHSVLRTITDQAQRNDALGGYGKMTKFTKDTIKRQFHPNIGGKRTRKRKKHTNKKRRKKHTIKKRHKKKKHKKKRTIKKRHKRRKHKKRTHKH